jgi:hypothetical protein
MSEAEDEIEATERALAAERKRLRELGERADVLERKTDPPEPPVDHANEGGII